MVKKSFLNKQGNRREFLKQTAKGAAFLIVPRHVLGGSAYIAPSDKLNIAAVGAGGRRNRLYGIQRTQTILNHIWMDSCLCR